MGCKKQSGNPVLVHREIPRGENMYNYTILLTWCNFSLQYIMHQTLKINIYTHTHTHTPPEENKHEKQKNLNIRKYLLSG